MKVILREDESGVSEVIGTILILSMTVVLFSAIIIWVTNIPTPVAQTRLDVQSSLAPMTDLGLGVNITLQHQGGEALFPTPTRIYVTSTRGAAAPKTDVVTLHPFIAGPTPSGIMDGTDSVWNVGERWSYRNLTLLTTDTITVTIVDVGRNSLLWVLQLTNVIGLRPPYFADKWADGFLNTTTADPVEAGANFFLFAKVQDPDGDLNTSSVYATITAWYNSGNPCAQPQLMKDNGVSPDRVAGDGVFTLGGSCLTAQISWDGSIVLLEAKDTAVPAHLATSRLILTVVTPSGPVSGSTLNAGFDTNLDGWSYLDWVDASSFASGNREASNGNPGGHVRISTNCNANNVVSGYYFQSFLVSGAGPFTATVNVDWRVTAFGATGGNVVLYVFVDTSPGAPTLGQQVWSSPTMTGTSSWASVSSVDASSRIPAAGTYYMKIAVVANHMTCGGTTRGAFDNAIVTWTSSG